MEEIRARAKELEAYADIIEMLEDRIHWFQNEDDDTGELIDEKSEYAKSQLSALRNTIKAVRKLAGV